MGTTAFDLNGSWGLSDLHGHGRGIEAALSVGDGVLETCIAIEAVVRGEQHISANQHNFAVHRVVHAGDAEGVADIWISIVAQ
ncbi:hypothetical protein D3C80_2141020 [compost metagenome]